MFAGWKELTIVTPSQWLADRVRGSFLNKHRAIVICNGVDTDIFHPRDCEALRRRYGLTTESVVLAVAPDIMSEQKGEKMDPRTDKEHERISGMFYHDRISEGRTEQDRVSGKRPSDHSYRRSGRTGSVLFTGRCFRDL